MNLTPTPSAAARRRAAHAIARFERWLETRRFEAELLAESDEEPGYTPDPEPMPAKAPRAMLAPTRSQVENGYITGQPTVKRTTKPGPKAEPKSTRRYNAKGPRR